MSDLDRFELPEELEEFRTIVRTIADERIAPRAAEIDEADEWPEDVYKLLVEHDLMGSAIPRSTAAWAAARSRSACSSRSCRACRRASRSPRSCPSSACIPLVVAGDDEKAKRMTEDLARGDLLMSYALTEAGAGSDPGADDDAVRARRR